jgi:hypothetical protein
MVEKEGFNVGEITKFGLLTLCLYFGGCHKWACPKITTKKLTKHRLQEHASAPAIYVYELPYRSTLGRHVLQFRKQSRSFGR